MANVLVDETALQDIADAIREQNGTQNTYKPGQMGDAVRAIESGGITPTGTVNINSNGTHDVTQYANANVNVPNSYAASDEGKVVNNGALVAQGSDTVTQNGTVDTTLINSLTVNVPSTTPTGTKQISITQNGTTTEDVTNYANAEITVDVSTGGEESWTWKEDGNTHIWLDITRSENLTQYISVGGNASAFPITINWGDGSPVITLTSNTTTQNHTYAEIGKYEIVLTSNGGAAYLTSAGMCNPICASNIIAIELSNQKTWSSNYGAWSRLPKLRHVNFGVSSGTANGLLSYCPSLIDVVLASGFAAAISQSFFQYDSSLKSIDLRRATSIGQTAFQYCFALESVTIPDTVTSIAANAFGYCVNLTSIHMKSQTPPTMSNSNSFTGMRDDCKIYVPYGSLSAYQAATGWSTYATHIVEET